MSQTLFLSTVTTEFGPLRLRLAVLLQRTKRVHVRHQDDFFHHGVKTLRMLEEEVFKSQLIIHVIGKEPGWCPPVDQVEDFLQRHPEFGTHFPELLDDAKVGTISATQWEVWLVLYFNLITSKDMRVLIFDFPDRLQPSSTQQQHSQRLHDSHHHPKSVATDEALYDEIILSLLGLGLLTEQDIHRPCHLTYSTLGELFIGRDGFLGKLRGKFQLARTATRWPKQAVCGVGGLGKTQVAVEYALRYRDDYTAVLMVNADTPESLRSGLAGLAGVLHSNLDPATPDDVKEQATLQWLKQHPGWLLIVDNVDTEAARNEVTRRLAQWADGHVLITARFHQWPKSVEALDLHVLSVDDAAKFLLQATDGKRAATSDDRRLARQLAGDDLDGLCLALEQAAAYIEERQITFAEYRLRWTENHKDARTWADKELMQYHTEQEVSLSVATTWLTTFRELTPAAQSLLQMLAWLSPEPIPQALLQHPKAETVFHTLQPGEDIETALAALRRYSLLSHRPGDPPDSAGRIHRVVQLITRECLNADQQRMTLMAMLQSVNFHTPSESNDVRTWSVLEPLRPHLTAIIRCADSAGIVKPTMRLMHCLAGMLLTKAQYNDAELLYRRAIELEERTLGAESTILACTLASFAGLLQTTNRVVDAEKLYRRALSIFEGSEGHQQELAGCLGSLSGLLFHMNRSSEAEPLLERAINILGPDSPSAATMLLCKARILLQSSRLTRISAGLKSMTILRRFVEKRSKFFDFAEIPSSI